MAMAARPDSSLRALSQGRRGSAYWVPLRPGIRHPLGPMIYVGRGLFSVRGSGPEPALIDLALPSAGEAECAVARLDSTTPSYSTCSPAARASYLCWLKTGRSDPGADMGYVWLYLYGLERRLLHDPLSDPAAAGERPALIGEVRRLLGIYGRHKPFQEQATRLLHFVGVLARQPRVYLEAPEAPAGRKLSLRDRLALGQCMQDAAVLPPAWAARWARHASWVLEEQLASGDPDIETRFASLFARLYQHRCGDGLMLRDDEPGRVPRLQTVYHPASPSFRGHEQGVSADSGVPDVEQIHLPPGLVAVAREASDALASARLPPSVSPLARLGATPLLLWPEPQRAHIQQLAQTVASRGGMLEATFQKLLAGLPPSGRRGTPQHRALCKLLARAGLAMEPDPDFGGSLPAAESTVVIFASEPRVATVSQRYAHAALQVQMAAPLVAAGGGEASRVGLAGFVEAFPALSEWERRRLTALLHRALVDPWMPPVTKIPVAAQLTAKGCRGMGDFLMHIALLGGEITPAQVAILQDRFELLGLGRAAVLPRVQECVRIGMVRLHPGFTAGTRNLPVPGKTRAVGGSPAQAVLDMARVAALQEESARLHALLDPVLASGGEPAGQCGEPGTPDSAAGSTGAWPGLDPAAVRFLADLAARTQWSRADLAALARTHGLPLDGTLERLNEATWEQFDSPLFEDGEDPLVLSPEALAAIRSLPGR
jgi:hypothetical protein